MADSTTSTSTATTSPSSSATSTTTPPSSPPGDLSTGTKIGIGIGIGIAGILAGALIMACCFSERIRLRRKKARAASQLNALQFEDKYQPWSVGRAGEVAWQSLPGHYGGPSSPSSTETGWKSIQQDLASADGLAANSTTAAAVASHGNGLSSVDVWDPQKGSYYGYVPPPHSADIVDHHPYTGAPYPGGDIPLECLPRPNKAAMAGADNASSLRRPSDPSLHVTSLASEKQQLHRAISSDQDPNVPVAELPTRDILPYEYSNGEEFELPAAADGGGPHSHPFQHSPHHPRSRAGRDMDEQKFLLSDMEAAKVFKRPGPAPQGGGDARRDTG